MELELCAGSYSAALLANTYPFKRVELCASLESGGLTPSAGTIVKVLKEVEAECHVLIRPRSGDFNYNQEELDVMRADIEFCKTVGCKGIVFGVLDEKQRFDLDKNLYLLDAVGDLQLTFHRAIDVSSDVENDLESIINCGFHRVLSSGLSSSAIQGLETLKRMKSQINNRLELMVGGGINASNILQLKENLKPEAIHFSATEHRKSGENSLFESTLTEVSQKKLQNIFHHLSASK
ncbi:MAG: copper homeostasis protein CutC [Lishizhenia sp.]